MGASLRVASLLLMLVVSTSATRRVLEVCGGIVTPARGSCSNCCALQKGCVNVKPGIGSITCIGGNGRACTRECGIPMIRVCPENGTATTIRVVSDKTPAKCPRYNIFTGDELVLNENANNQLESSIEELVVENENANNQLESSIEELVVERESASSAGCLKGAVEVCYGTVQRELCATCCSLKLGCIDLGPNRQKNVCIPSEGSFCILPCLTFVSACSSSIPFKGTTVDYTSCHSCRNPSKPNCALYSRFTGKPLCLKNVLLFGQEQF